MHSNHTVHIPRLTWIFAETTGYSPNTLSLRIANPGSLFDRLEYGKADPTIQHRATIFANSPKIALVELDCRSDALVSDDRALRVSGWSAAYYSAGLLKSFERFCDTRKTGVC